MNIDSYIVLGYFILIILIGLAVSKKASGSIDEYFLGGRSIPWYILGISGMATFIDISGTAFQVSFFYMVGAKGFWYCFLGAIPLVLAFLMIYIGKWMTRSGVMTNAEWMIFRFGENSQGNLARILSGASISIAVIAFLGVFFVGCSKTLPLYIPTELIPDFIPEQHRPNVIATIFMVMVMIYTVASGFYGVVYTDVLQAFLIFGIIVYVAYSAMTIGTPEYFSEHSTPAWRELFPENWLAGFPDSWKLSLQTGPQHSQMGILVLVAITTMVLWGFATPFESWTAQRYYAAKDERESSLIAWQWIFLFSFRFMLMAGIGVLALQLSTSITDPEQALGMVIRELIPIGIRGLLLAALLAAAMSTVDSFVNASAAYFVKDVYQAFINPAADGKKLMKVSYLMTFSIMTIGILLGWFVDSIGNIWGWIVMGLFTGMTFPNILKWFWWRFNGVGFAGGMVAGIVAAILFTFWGTDIMTGIFGADIVKNEYLFYPVYEADKITIEGYSHMEHVTWMFVSVISVLGTFLSVFLGKPTDMNTLVDFYKRTKPFGFWGPVRAHCEPEFVAEVKTENKRDMSMILPACLWQVFLYWMMTSIVLKKWDAFIFSAIVVALISFILYKVWYKNLKAISPSQQKA